MSIGNQDKSWAPHIVCNTCKINLSRSIEEKLNKMSFGVPIVWRKPKDHFSNCYFCLVKTFRFSNKNKCHIVYPNLCSATRPILHSDQIAVPTYESPLENQGDVERNYPDFEILEDASCKYKEFDQQ
uniref:Putative LOC101234556 [Hydra vulgaris] n=1 Tax=Lepeophtheirus salmonis TaxID=72036 RepID=A0A0K2TLE3_LEPSM